MASVRRNIVANFAAKGLTAAMALVFPPLYHKLLGAESYGLVGFFGTLIAVLGILDLGLAVTLNRQLARLSAVDSVEAKQEARDIVRTHEVVFWLVGVVVGCALLALAPLIARRWISVDQLSQAQAANAVRVMGLIFLFQWPGAMYSGGLQGLQRQVVANAIHVLFTTLRTVGAALILWKVSRTIHAFLIWQSVTTIGQTIATGWVLGRALPGGALSGAFRLELLRKHWRFSAGMSGISILAVILMQADKLVVSKIFALREFGDYTLAATAGNGLYFLIGPVFAAVFPRLSQLVASGDTEELTRLYHQSCQAMAVVVLPAALVIGLFAREVLLAWRGDAGTAARTWPVLAAIAAGTAMSGLMNLPYGLQVAHGWTRLTLHINVVAVILVVPLVYFLGRRFGVTGAALGWTVLNAGYVLVGIRLMHRRVLPRELRNWYVFDVGLPLLGALAIVVPLRVLLPMPATRIGILLLLAVVGALTMMGAALGAPILRARGFASVARWRRGTA